jgi:hypothetical protein
VKVTVITPLKQIVIVPYVDDFGVWDGVMWITLTDINFHIGVEHVIPAGFLTDMGSIPRIARMGVDRMGKSLVGFIVHDWLYTKDAPVSRKVADQVLYQLSRHYGESWYTSRKIYYAVRSMGWTASMTPNVYVGISGNTVLKVINDNLNSLESVYRHRREFLSVNYSNLLNVIIEQGKAISND